MATRRQFLARTAAAGIATVTAAHGAESATWEAARAIATMKSLKSYRVPHTELAVSRLAYGLAMIDIHWRDNDLISRSVQGIRTAYEQSITFFDTADAYASGASEMALGQFFRGSSALRDSIVIQSKCGARASHGFAPGDPIRIDTRSKDFSPNLSRLHIINAVEATLRRMRTDRLDILLLHRTDALSEPQEIAQAFDELHASGKVRYFGVSNHSVAQMELLRGHSRQRLIACQTQLGLARYSAIEERSTYGSLVDYCRLHDMQVQAYSPLRGRDILSRPPLLNPPTDATPQVKQAAQILADIARRHDVSPASMMLAWLLRHPAGVVPVIGASKLEHIIDNCTADRVTLDRNEWYTLFYAAEPIQDVA